MKKALGKGLDALLLSRDESEIREIRLNDIAPGKQQPRKIFDEEKLRGLSESIKQHGVVQPIIVCKDGDIYRIVAGERRWRAARMAGLATIPAVIREYDSKSEMEIALIENLQREDLNALEEAEAYKALIEQYQLSQQEIADIIGKSRSAIANSLRILKLDDRIKEDIKYGRLSEGHARAILAVEDEANRRKLAEDAVNKGLSVRECEEIARRLQEDIVNNSRTQEKAKSEKQNRKIEYSYIENSLRKRLGTQVRLLAGRNKGKIVIEYYSDEELDRILDIIKNE